MQYAYSRRKAEKLANFRMFCQRLHARLRKISFWHSRFQIIISPVLRAILDRTCGSWAIFESCIVLLQSLNCKQFENVTIIMRTLYFHLRRLSKTKIVKPTHKQNSTELAALFCFPPPPKCFWEISENLIIKRLEYKPGSFKFTFILSVTV